MALNETIHICGSFTNFLDLQCHFVNTLSGGNSIFIGIAAFAYLLLSAYLRMPIGAIGAGLVLLGAILTPINPAIFVLSIVVGLVMVAISLAQIKR